MSLRVAIIYEDDKVWIEFSPEKFKELLNKYFEKTKSIDKSLDKIIEDIKKETKYK